MKRIRRARREDGASAVEFAVLVPVVLLLVVGFVQFGLIFSQWLQLEHSAREGARWAGLRNEADFVREQVIASAPGLGIGAGDITINPGDPVTAQPNTPIEVTVSHETPVISPLMEGLIGEGISMTARATQRVE